MNITLIFLCGDRHNIFQYFFVTTDSFYFVIISETLVQIITIDKKHKWNIDVKNPLTKKYNTTLVATKKVCQLNWCF